MIGIVNDQYDVGMRMRFFPKSSRLIDRTGLRLSAARDLTLILAHFGVCVDPSTPAFMSETINRLASGQEQQDYDGIWKGRGRGDNHSNHLILHGRTH
jgi:hypothetical protein